MIPRLPNTSDQPVEGGVMFETHRLRLHVVDGAQRAGQEGAAADDRIGLEQPIVFLLREHCYMWAPIFPMEAAIPTSTRVSANAIGVHCWRRSDELTRHRAP
jgi:hypothetical protein